MRTIIGPQEDLLKRFIIEGDVDIWHKLLRFIHGTPDPNRSILLRHLPGHGLPTSHTCSGALELINYFADYNMFKTKLLTAITETSGAHTV